MALVTHQLPASQSGPLQAKQLRERMAAARKVAQSVRSMLPDSSTAGENEDLEEADADEMRALQVGMS